MYAVPAIYVSSITAASSRLTMLLRGLCPLHPRFLRGIRLHCMIKIYFHMHSFLKLFIPATYREIKFHI